MDHATLGGLAVASAIAAFSNNSSLSLCDHVSPVAREMTMREKYRFLNADLAR